MKKAFSILIIFISARSFAQDTTKVKGLQLQARLIEYLAPIIMNPDNDSLYQVYIDLRPKFRIANPPTGTTLVTIDSIPTLDLAALYNYALSNSDGLSQGNTFKIQLTSVRAANAYLERLCNDHELYWTDKLADLRKAGRKLLKGK